MKLVRRHWETKGPEEQYKIYADGEGKWVMVVGNKENDNGHYEQDDGPRIRRLPTQRSLNKMRTWRKSIWSRLRVLKKVN